MAGITKKGREERKAYLKSLIEQGYSYVDALQRYDAKFGTHYSDRDLPRSCR